MSALLRAAATRFEALEPTLNRLDAATGDGDHGATMVKGCAPQQRPTRNPVRPFARQQAVLRVCCSRR